MKFRRDLRYTLCEDKLEDFHDDLIMLDDWIPFIITSNLPQDVFFKLGKMLKTKKNIQIDYYSINWKMVNGH